MSQLLARVRMVAPAQFSSCDAESPCSPYDDEITSPHPKSTRDHVGIPFFPILNDFLSSRRPRMPSVA